MGRAPKNPLADLAKTAKAQLSRAEKLGASLDLRLKQKQNASDTFTLDEDYRRDFAAVTQAIQHSGKMLIQAHEANKSHLDGMTEAQLEAQFAAELVRCAQTLTEAEWQLMLDARAKKNA